MSQYKKLSTEFYDISKPRAGKEEVNFYTTFIRQSSPPFLEAMCGSGRLLIPLLEQGFDIEGVDNSEQMLESCKNKCSKLNLQPLLYHQDISTLSIPKKYGAIIITVGSFQLIHDQAQALQTLKHLHSHLQPHGILILDTFMPETDEPAQETLARVVECSDRSIINLTSRLVKDEQHQIYTGYNHYEKIIEHDIVETEDEIIKIRWYTEPQMKMLLMQAGFSSYELYRNTFDDQHVSLYVAQT